MSETYLLEPLELECIYCHNNIYIHQEQSEVVCNCCRKHMSISRKAFHAIQEGNQLNEEIKRLREQGDAQSQTILSVLHTQWNNYCQREEGEIRELYRQGEEYQRNGQFDEAIRIYQDLLKKIPNESEIHWRIMLCTYGIEYVRDQSSGESLPTFTRMNVDDILRDENYIKARQYAPNVQMRRFYTDEGRRINGILGDYQRINGLEQPYDVFISVKQGDESGNITNDAYEAGRLYHLLKNQGYRVFNSRESLNLGDEYEPYIMHALSTAKVLILVASKQEYLDAPWLKNEWRRFNWLRKNEPSVSRKLVTYIIGNENMNLHELGKIQYIRAASHSDPLTALSSVVTQVCGYAKDNHESLQALTEYLSAAYDGEMASYACSQGMRILNKHLSEINTGVEPTLPSRAVIASGVTKPKPEPQKKDIARKIIRPQPLNPTREEIAKKYTSPGEKPTMEAIAKRYPHPGNAPLKETIARRHTRPRNPPERTQISEKLKPNLPKWVDLLPMGIIARYFLFLIIGGIGGYLVDLFLQNFPFYYDPSYGIVLSTTLVILFIFIGSGGIRVIQLIRYQMEYGSSYFKDKQNYRDAWSNFEKEVEITYKRALADYNAQLTKYEKDVEADYIGEIEAYNARLQKHNSVAQIYQSELTKYLERLKQYNSSIDSEYECTSAEYQANIDAYNAAVDAEYHRELKAHQDSVKACNNVIDTLYNQAMTQYAQQMEAYRLSCDIANAQRTTLQYLISAYYTTNEEIKDRLSILYKQGILHETFRNIIAIHQFREYLAMGVCDRLDGINGAGSRYLDNIRAKEIISSLNELLTALSQENGKLPMMQKSLGEALQSIDSLVHSMSDTVKNALKNVHSSEDKLTKAPIMLETALSENDEYARSIETVVKESAFNQFIVERASNIIQPIQKTR